MSNPKRTLAEKITIMQAADAGAKIAVKAETSDRYVTVKSPDFNWGISDYAVINDNRAMLEQLAEKAFNYDDLVVKANAILNSQNYQEAFKKSIKKYKDNINTEVGKKLDNLDTGVNSTNFDDMKTSSIYTALMSAYGNDEAQVQAKLRDFLREIDNTVIKPKIKNSIKSVIETSFDETPANDPAEATTEKAKIQQIVKELTDQAKYKYDKQTAGTVASYQKDGFILNVYKSEKNETHFELIYAAAKNSTSETEGIFKTTFEYKEPDKITYTDNTVDELNKQAEKILFKAATLNKAMIDGYVFDYIHPVGSIYITSSDKTPKLQFKTNSEWVEIIPSPIAGKHTWERIS